MGILTGLLANWKLLLYATVAMALAAGAFYVKGRFAKADQADRLSSINQILQKQHDFQQIQQRKLNDENVLLSAQIKAFEEKIGTDVQTVTKVIKVHVHDNRTCDVPVEVLKGLNQARGQP